MARSPMFYSAVFVLLENDAGEVLLQRRINTGFMDGHYDMSATGHVDDGSEYIVDAAIRETKEEIGVDIAPGDLIMVMAAQMNADRPYLNYTFLCKKWQGEPTIMEPEKCDDLKWVKKDKLPELLTPTLHLLKGRKFSEMLGFEYMDLERRKKIMGMRSS